MSLDADLGIDSIKRVEILSALQEAHAELPAIEAEELGNLQTITDVLNTLNKSTGTAPAATTVVQEAPAIETANEVDERIHRQCVELIEIADTQEKLRLT